MMTPQQIEDLFIRSLDVPMNASEKESFLAALQENGKLSKVLSDHKTIRQMTRATTPATFGYYFASKLITRIENTGVVIDRQIFSFFKKYQLAAAGVIVALLILNTVFADQLSVGSIFGLESTTTTSDEIVSFDFYESLNNDL